MFIRCLLLWLFKLKLAEGSPVSLHHTEPWEKTVVNKALRAPSNLLLLLLLLFYLLYFTFKILPCLIYKITTVTVCIEIEIIEINKKKILSFFNSNEGIAYTAKALISFKKQVGNYECFVSATINDLSFKWQEEIIKDW